MVLKRTPVEVPLFIGMGEGQDAQNRSQSNERMRNVLFSKDGAVESRRDLEVISTQVPHSRPSLVLGRDGVLVTGSDGITRITPDGVSLDLDGTFSPVDFSDSYFSTSDDSSAWCRATYVGSTLFAFWVSPMRTLVPDYGRMRILYSTFHEDGSTKSENTELIDEVSPNYVALQGSSSTVIVSHNEDDEIYVTSLTEAGAATLVATVDVTTVFTSPERLYRISATLDGTDTVICASTGYTGDTSGTSQRGQTALIRVTAGGTVTSSVLDDGTSASNHYGANALSVMGTAPDGTLWVACGDYHDAFMYVYTVSSGSLTPTTATAADSVFSWSVTFTHGTTGANNSQNNGTLNSLSPAISSDGRFVFSDNSDAYLVTHGQRALQVRSVYPTGGLDVTSDSSYAVGTQVNYLGSSPSAGSVSVFPGVSLASDPWLTDDGVRFVAVEEDYFLHQLGGQNYAVPGEMEEDYSVNITSGAVVTVSPAISHPLYKTYVACLADPTNYVRRVDGLFGYDEATRHTEVAREWQHPGATYAASVSPPVPLTNYLMVVGATVEVNGEQRVLTPRRKVFKAAAYDGYGISVSETSLAKYRVGWGVSFAWTTFGGPVVVTGVGTADAPILSMGVPATVDRDHVMALHAPCPPVPPAGLFLGNGGASTYNRNYRFVWAWEDSRGIIHRGPPSHEVELEFNNWSFEDDFAYMQFPAPPVLPGFQREKTILEVYANPVTDVPDIDSSSMVLIGSYRPPDFNQGEPWWVDVSIRVSASILPLIYTFGGELPNEAAPSNANLTYASNRVWSSEGPKAFFSKRVEYNTPSGFNQNLYVTAPDGNDVTALASLDEQVIGFTRDSVFLIRGVGPNDAGSGSAHSVQPLPSPSGATSYRGVVSTDSGVFFAGYRGVHLLDRKMSVSFVGRNVEDSLDPSSIISSYWDKEKKEVGFCTGDTSFVFSLISGAWSEVSTASGITHMTWSPLVGPVSVTESAVYGVDIPRDYDPDEAYPKGEYLPMEWSTPWVSLATSQGYQRAYKFKIRGKATLGDRFIPADYSDPQNPVDGYLEPETRTRVTFKVFVDHEDTPSHVLIKDLRQQSQLDPLELQIPVGSRQKCEAIRLQIETEQSSMWLRITSIVLEAGIKRGIGARPNTSPS